MSETTSEAVLAVSIDEETGEMTNNGSHGVHIVHAGGAVTRIAPGESFIPAKDGQPAVILRTRPATGA